jgi:putative acyl-CoA dehydrogenase
MAEFEDVRGAHPAYDRFVQRLAPLLDAMDADEYAARPATEALARAIQGAELLRHSTGDVVDAFMATRLGDGGWGTMLGALPAAFPRARADAIVDRAQVVRR